MDDRRIYNPGPDSIAVACERIRATWSDDERRRRLRGLMPGHRYAQGDSPELWTPPVIAVTPEVAAALETM